MAFDYCKDNVAVAGVRYPLTLKKGAGSWGQTVTQQHLASVWTGCHFHSGRFTPCPLSRANGGGLENEIVFVKCAPALDDVFLTEGVPRVLWTVACTRSLLTEFGGWVRAVAK